MVLLKGDQPNSLSCCHLDLPLVLVLSVTQCWAALCVELQLVPLSQSVSGIALLPEPRTAGWFLPLLDLLSFCISVHSCLQHCVAGEVPSLDKEKLLISVGDLCTFSLLSFQFSEIIWIFEGVTRASTATFSSIRLIPRRKR